ncbi:hypothetical protein M758_8G092400 [Ceratodon purpureus]|uniref:Uncharacterized protein n=1 Tax=Ceratodon purpureus TaxID=3225 RepID=A0A8T0H1M1_CERPU|nr:hypothetical protein KC19_8G096300 [Ceratodon purpureus]KAG0608264.1 hypothetical protein M758_8G092400 [Ceratodon purpureus]
MQEMVLPLAAVFSVALHILMTPDCKNSDVDGVPAYYFLPHGASRNKLISDIRFRCQSTYAPEIQ